MFRGLSAQSFNPFHCCVRNDRGDTERMPRWMESHKGLGKRWVDDARQCKNPPTWCETYFEKGGCAVADARSVLRDLMTPNHDSQEKYRDPALLALRSPQSGGPELAQFVDHLMLHDVRYLLVLGDASARALRLNTTAQDQCHVTENQNFATVLTQSPALPATPEGWAATLEIQHHAAAGELPEPAPQQIRVLHVQPKQAGLLDPDELRTLTQWITAAGPRSPVAITGESGDTPESLGLPAMFGQIAATMAILRRHQYRNPYIERGGTLADAPMRELFRELHQRDPGYICSWRHLAAVAAVADGGTQADRLLPGVETVDLPPPMTFAAASSNPDALAIATHLEESEVDDRPSSPEIAAEESSEPGNSPIEARLEGSQVTRPLAELPYLGNPNVLGLRWHDKEVARPLDELPCLGNPKVLRLRWPDKVQQDNRGFVADERLTTSLSHETSA
ncbi:hypothetical protein SAMN05216359_10366 [Roseateles sp. YR242]|uniref:hypothetical protein n=1 Tax=Roseateles sp. YR242 TaxID=1855305 RepID=UPI0008CCA036|nr:hypothetical protein [Roseateles sp. YR242]SEK78392.1 hypothetical protein SAMN05216359_10366 [Roseateles sp. YR242]